jgi:hypothetical protein
VERRGCDPQVVGVGSIMKCVTRSTTGESELGEGREEPIADGNDRGCVDRLIEAVAARFAPSGHEGAVSELAHGDRGQEDLVSGHQADLRLEPRPPATAERRAEHASVDDNPHESSAAAKASSSSSDNSSIRSASIEARTGAAASCSSVRSLGNSAVPCGASC